MGISATSLSVPAAADEVTLTSTASVLSVKGATGAANAASGVVVLDAGGLLPAVDGSALTKTPMGEGHITILPVNYSAIVQGDWALNAPTSEFIGAFGNNVTPLVNDELDYLITLSAGTYTLRMVYYRDTSCAIATFKLNDTTIGTIDMYGAAAFNTIGTITGIVVATNGLYTLKFIAASKHASSSGYWMNPYCFCLFRTA